VNAPGSRIAAFARALCGGLAAEGADVFVFEIAELLGGVGFAAQVRGFGSAELQARGEFVGGDAGFEFAVALRFTSSGL